jgi:hypothetical protein
MGQKQVFHIFNIISSGFRRGVRMLLHSCLRESYIEERKVAIIYISSSVIIQR